ncbi:VP5 [Sathuvachari virus]|nr:VP5 [Sathuvachari virus]
MGKFTNFLSRIGSSAAKVVNSSTTKAILKGVGSAASKVIQSEVGQRVITGAIEGTVRSALTGENYGDNIKKSIILNVAGISNEVPDPLNRVEHELIDSVNCLRKDKRAEELKKKFDAKIQELYDEEKVITKYLEQNVEATDEEEDQIGVLNQAMRVLTNAVSGEKEKLEMVEKALRKEEESRSDNEKRIISYVKHNYDQLAQIAQAERDGLIEEATQTSIEIGAEVAEHLAEVFPVVGGIMASSAAGARGVVQLYNIGKLIHGLTNLHIDHINVPALTQETIASMVRGDDFKKDNVLLRAITSKISAVDEMHSEVKHVDEHIVKNIKKIAFTDSFNQGGKGKGIPHSTKVAVKIPKTQIPGIHIYTSSWDSDYVMIFHVVGPYSQRSTFLFCVDLLLDFVGIYDVIPQHHSLFDGTSKITGDYSFQAAISDFFTELQYHGANEPRHLQRIARSAQQQVMHVGDMPYEVSYTKIRENAECIARDSNAQLHLLRGPLAMQRRNFLNALLHGILVIEPMMSRSTL